MVSLQKIMIFWKKFTTPSSKVISEEERRRSTLISSFNIFGLLIYSFFIPFFLLDLDRFFLAIVIYLLFLLLFPLIHKLSHSVYHKYSTVLFIVFLDSSVIITTFNQGLLAQDMVFIALIITIVLISASQLFYLKGLLITSFFNFFLFFLFVLYPGVQIEKIEIITSLILLIGIFILVIIANHLRLKQLERLNLSLEKLEDQRNELSMFAHTMKHDLRNNLSTMSLYIDFYEQENSEFKKKLKIQISKIDILLQKSVELADSGIIIEKNEIIDLHKLLLEAAEVTLNDSVTISISNLPKVLSDHVKLFQVFKNIFENTIMHAKTTKIDIISEIIANNLLLSIKNNGFPIKYEIMRNFNTDILLKEIDKKHLGLSIIKRIIRAHGWDVVIEVSEDTIFKIVIPLEDVIK